MSDLAAESASSEAVRFCLKLGRLLLANGADTAEVHTAVAHVASGLGFQAHVLLTYEAMLVTVDTGNSSQTRVGRHLPPSIVNMTAIEALNRIAAEVAGKSLDLKSAVERLSAVEQNAPLYPGWLVALMVGLSAASLSRLLGGSWSVFVVVWLSSTVGTFVRQRLNRKQINSFAIPFLTVLVSGVIADVGMRFHPGSMQYLSLLAPGLILVPGVPLITAIGDIISNNLGIACAKLTFVSFAIFGITLGLFAAALTTGVAIPVAGPTPLLSTAQDAVFSAITTIGFVFLFNVRFRLAWACVLCGLSGHTSRTFLMHLGLDIVSSTLIGSLAIGVAARAFANAHRVPPATFAFPAVLALIPGSFAFRAVLGWVDIMRTSERSPVPLQAETLSLVFTTIMLATVIAIGLAVPMAIPANIRHAPDAGSADAH